MRRSFEKEKEQAFRIMEALSGVDEELLERSEQTRDCAAEFEIGDAGKTGKPDAGKRIYRFMRRHGRAWAACLCMAFLGAAFWGLTLAHDGSGQNVTTDYSGAAAADIKTESVAEAAPQTSGEEAAGGIEAERAAEGGSKSDAGEPETETMGTKLPEEGLSRDGQDVSEALIEDSAEQELQKFVNSGMSASKPEQSEEENSQKLTFVESAELLFQYIYPDIYDSLFSSCTVYYSADEGGQYTDIVSYPLYEFEYNGDTLQIFCRGETIDGRYFIFAFLSWNHYLDDEGERVYTHANYWTSFAVNRVTKEIIMERTEIVNEEEDLAQIIYSDEYQEIVGDNFSNVIQKEAYD